MEGAPPEVSDASMQGQTVVYVGKASPSHLSWPFNFMLFVHLLCSMDVCRDSNIEDGFCQLQCIYCFKQMI